MLTPARRSPARSALARTSLALLLLAGTATACGGGGDDDSDDARSPITRDEDATTTTEEEESTTTTTEEQTPGLDLEDIPVEDQDDAIIEATLTEVENFWDQAFPDVYGSDFQRVEGGFFPYGPDRELPPCEGVTTYDDIAFNAFYCPSNDLIAWDTDNLTNDMLDQFGAFSLAIVMAHEYGHAVQARVPVNGPTIETEQQADCFAGAFTAFINEGGSDLLAVSVDDLDSAVAGFLSLRDAVGTPADDPSAHGSAFDRVGAFQDGFLNGTERCAEYQDIYDGGGSTVIDLQFTTEEDFQSGGNAPFDPREEGNIFELTLGSLEAFWIEAMPAQFGVDWNPLFQEDQIVPFNPDNLEQFPFRECPGADVTAEDERGRAFTCFGDPEDPEDDFIAFDVNLAAQQYDEVGDFAVSGILSQQYALVAQVLLGNFESDKPSLLQSDCFSGAWSGELTIATLTEGGQALPDGSSVAISAGDLDEIVQSFLLLGEEEGADEAQGTPFERIAAFRDGFLNGLPQCATYLEGGVPDEDEAVPQEEG